MKFINEAHSFLNNMKHRFTVSHLSFNSHTVTNSTTVWKYSLELRGETQVVAEAEESPKVWGLPGLLYKQVQGQPVRYCLKKKKRKIPINKDWLLNWAITARFYTCSFLSQIFSSVYMQQNRNIFWIHKLCYLIA